MGGHVFISYSRDDLAYVRSLVEFFNSAGIDVWTDDTIDHGDRWAHTIRGQVDGCAALVPVMTPAAEASTWVEREIARAEEMGKPILPLLRSGQPFFRLANLQYDDVTTGGLPSQRFLDRLVTMAGTQLARTGSQPVLVPAGGSPPGGLASRPAGSAGAAPVSIAGTPPGAPPSAGGRPSRGSAVAGWIAMAFVLASLVVPFVLGDADGRWHRVTVPLTALVACIAVARRGVWTFAASVGVLAVLPWVVLVLTQDRTQPARFSEDSRYIESGNVPALITLGAVAVALVVLVVVNRFRHRAPVATWHVIVAALIAVLLLLKPIFDTRASDWSLWRDGAYQGLLEAILVGFVPYLILLFQATWERDLVARRLAVSSVVIFGALYSTYALAQLADLQDVSHVAWAGILWDSAKWHFVCGAALLGAGIYALVDLRRKPA